MPCSQAGLLGQARLDLVDQHAHDDAQQRTGQYRRRHHQAFLRRRQTQVGSDLHRERAQQHPDHEAQVEIEKCREQRGLVSNLPEA